MQFIDQNIEVQDLVPVGFAENEFFERLNYLGARGNSDLKG